MCYNNGYTNKVIKGIRKINKVNFNPMAHNLIDKGFMDNYVQIYIDVIGGTEWVNVKKSDIH